MTALGVQAVPFRHLQKESKQLFLDHPRNFVPVVGPQAMLYIGSGIQRQQKQAAQALFRIPLGKRFLQQLICISLQNPF